MQNTKENKMGVQNVNSLLLSMAIPMMISMLVQALYNIVDTMFVSKLGQDALTALSLAFPVQNLLIAVSVGTGVGVNALLSRSLGEKNFDRANRVAENGVFLSIISSIVVMILGFTLVKPYFGSFGSSERIIALGTDYLSICMIFSFGLFGQVMFEKLLQATGKTAYSMVVQLVGAVTNIILDPIMIYGLIGFPAMGVKGAALATVTGQIVALIVGIVINSKFNREIKVTLKGSVKPNGEIIKRIYAVGIPSICMASIGSVMNVCINQTMRLFSDSVAATGQAVFGIYFKLQSFVFMPIFGINNSMVPIVAYNFGAKNPERIKKTIKLSVIYACIIMAAGFLAFQTVPETLLRIFDTGGDDMKEIIRIGKPMMRSISLSFIAAGYCIVAGSVFQALGKGMLSLIVSVLRQLVVLVPVAFLLAYLTRDITIMWLSFPIAEIASFTMSYIFMKKIYKNEINTLK
ncbi:MAG: MATE family efflux transporter [Clostridia bacterium]|nr:MATE family efflux transporter [Clostridia bacterium]